MRGGTEAVELSFVAAAIVTVIFVVITWQSGGEAPFVAFLALWIACMSWGGYWWLWRVAAELIVGDGSIVSFSPFRTRRVAIDAIVGIRPRRLGPYVVIIEIKDERPIITHVAKGIRELTDELARLRPGLPVRLGWRARLVEHRPGRSRVDRL